MPLVNPDGLLQGLLMCCLPFALKTFRFSLSNLSLLGIYNLLPTKNREKKAKFIEHLYHLCVTEALLVEEERKATDLKKVNIKYFRNLGYLVI